MEEDPGPNTFAPLHQFGPPPAALAARYANQQRPLASHKPSWEDPTPRARGWAQASAAHQQSRAAEAPAALPSPPKVNPERLNPWPNVPWHAQPVTTGGWGAPLATPVPKPSGWGAGGSGANNPAAPTSGGWKVPPRQEVSAQNSWPDFEGPSSPNNTSLGDYAVSETLQAWPSFTSDFEAVLARQRSKKPTKKLLPEPYKRLRDAQEDGTPVEGTPTPLLQLNEPLDSEGLPNTIFDLMMSARAGAEDRNSSPPPPAPTPVPPMKPREEDEHTALEKARRHNYKNPLWQPFSDSATSKELQGIQVQVRTTRDAPEPGVEPQLAVVKAYIRRQTRAHFTTRHKPGVKLAAYMDLGSTVDLVTLGTVLRLGLAIRQVPRMAIQGWNPQDAVFDSETEVEIPLIPNVKDKRFEFKCYPVRFRVVPSLYGEEDLVLSDLTMWRMGLLAGARIMQPVLDDLQLAVTEELPEDPWVRAAGQFASPPKPAKVPRGASPVGGVPPDSAHLSGVGLEAELEQGLRQHIRKADKAEQRRHARHRNVSIGPAISDPEPAVGLGPMPKEVLNPSPASTASSNRLAQYATGLLNTSTFSPLLGPIPKEPSDKLKAWPCKFEVDESKLIPQPHRLHSPERSDFLRETVRKWEENNYITTAPTKGPVMQMTVQQKPHGRGYRVCLDGRSLNAAIKRESLQEYPLPDIRQAVRQAARARFRSSVDLREAFFQTVVHQDSARHMTASTGRGGINFQFLRLFFGLNIATAYFQWLMSQKVFKECIDAGYLIVYVDDVVIYSNSEEEHQRHIKRVLEIMLEWGLRFAADKCHWATREMKFLGRSIEGNIITVPQEYIDELVSTSPPATIKQLRSMIGKVNWIQQFIPNHAAVTGILNSQLKNSIQEATELWRLGHAGDSSPPPRWLGRHPVQWDSWHHDKAREAWWECAIIKPLRTPLRLHPLSPDRHTFMETDACDQGMGAVLFQCDKVVQLDGVATHTTGTLPLGKRYLCGVWSKGFTPLQQRWSTGDQELYASVLAMLHWREWVACRPFTCLTDHRNTLFSAHKDLENSSIRVQRAVERLQEFPVLFVHIRGDDNVAADYFSRRFEKQVAPTVLQLERAIIRRILTGSSAGDIRLDDQAKDSVSQDWSDWDADGWENGPDVALDPLWSWQGPEEPFTGDLLPAHETSTAGDEAWERVRHTRAVHHGGGAPEGQPDLPLTGTAPLKPVQIDGLISLFHNEFVGHGAVDRTVRALRQRGLNWPNMRNDVRDYVRECAFCQRNDPRTRGRTLGPREGGILPLPRRPRDIVAMDTIGPLWQADESEPKHILAFIDAFSRHIYLAPVQQLTAPAVAEALLRYIGDFGCPGHFYSDHGTAFDNLVMKDLAQMMGFEWMHSRANVHQSNGLVERLNGEIGRHLRALIHSLPKERGKLLLMLPCIQRIINGAYHSAIGTAPAKLVFGDSYDSDKFLLPPVVEDPDEGDEWGPNLGTNDLDVSQDDIPAEGSPYHKYHTWLKDLSNNLEILSATSVLYQRDALRKRHGVKPGNHTLEEIKDQLNLGPPVPKGAWVWHHRDTAALKANAADNYPWRGPYLVHSECPPNQSSVHVTNPRGRDVTKVFTLTRSSLKLARTSRLDEMLTCRIPSVEQWPVEAVVGHKWRTADIGKGRGSAPKRSWSEVLVRIRWEGFSPADDSWVKPKEAPKEELKKYLHSQGVAHADDLSDATYETPECRGFPAHTPE